jgi:hypothetical protein
MTGEERLVSQADDNVCHAGIPAVEPRDLRRFLVPGGERLADCVDEGGFFSFFGKGSIVRKPRPFEKTILSVLWSGNSRIWAMPLPFFIV